MTSNTSLSFQELHQAEEVPLVFPDTLQADDGIALSYRRYCPPDPKSVVLFYHGAGSHGGSGYQCIGHGLQSQYHSAVYIPDIRGHGDSEGPRGDVTDPNRIFADITTFIRHIRKTHPDLPLFLGGHSTGAGMVLNYASLPLREKVTGYIFLAPQFGPLAQADRPKIKPPFVKIDDIAFVTYTLSGGKLRGNHYAVKFNYPPEILADNPKLLTAITVNMAVALTPIAPKEQFYALDRPFGLWIGSDDELLLPDNVLALAGLAKLVRADSQISAIAGEKHLSILVKAHETIGPWINRFLQG